MPRASKRTLRLPRQIPELLQRLQIRRRLPSTINRSARCPGLTSPSVGTPSVFADDRVADFSTSRLCIPVSRSSYASRTVENPGVAQI